MFLKKIIVSAFAALSIMAQAQEGQLSDTKKAIEFYHAYEQRLLMAPNGLFVFKQVVSSLANPAHSLEQQGEYVFMREQVGNPATERFWYRYKTSQAGEPKSDLLVDPELLIIRYADKLGDSWSAESGPISQDGYITILGFNGVLPEASRRVRYIVDVNASGKGAFDGREAYVVKTNLETSDPELVIRNTGVTHTFYFDLKGELLGIDKVFFARRMVLSFTKIEFDAKLPPNTFVWDK